MHSPGGHRLLVLTGIGLFATASAILASFPSSQGVVGVVPIFAVALSLLRSTPPSFLSKEAPKWMQGEAMGYLDSASSICRVIAPTIAGALADLYGYGAPFWMCSGLCVVAGATSEAPISSFPNLAYLA